MKLRGGCSMIKYCKQCHDANNNETGYFIWWKKTDNNCPICHSDWQDVDYPLDDLVCLQFWLKCSQKFIDAMIALYQTDIMAYEEKMTPLRVQGKQMQTARSLARKQQSNLPHCPKCGSTSISTVNRGFSIVTGFIGSGSPRNVCQKCGYKWKP